MIGSISTATTVTNRSSEPQYQGFHYGQQQQQRNDYVNHGPSYQAHGTQNGSTGTLLPSASITDQFGQDSGQQIDAQAYQQLQDEIYHQAPPDNPPYGSLRRISQQRNPPQQTQGSQSQTTPHSRHQLHFLVQVSPECRGPVQDLEPIAAIAGISDDPNFLIPHDAVREIRRLTYGNGSGAQ